jgi:hypothetical protein
LATAVSLLRCNALDGLSRRAHLAQICRSALDRRVQNRARTSPDKSHTSRPNGFLALLPACGTAAGAAVILNIASTTLSGFTLNANNVAGGIDGRLGITYLALGW